MRGRGRREEGARVEIWIRPSGQAAAPSSQRGGSESSRDSEQDGELGSLSVADVSLCVYSLIHISSKSSVFPLHTFFFFFKFAQQPDFGFLEKITPCLQTSPIRFYL